MSTPYNDVDRLILDRWDEVTQLIDARDELRERIAEVIAAAGERLQRSLDASGYVVATDGPLAEFRISRTSWELKRRGPAVEFVLQGFAPYGYLKKEEEFPCIWLQTGNLESYKLKEPQRRAFAAELRSGLGDSAPEWDDDSCIEAEAPLVRYLREYDRKSRRELVASSERLYTFAMDTVQKALAISDVVDRCLRKTLGL